MSGSSMRRARLWAAALVGALVASGTAISLGAGSGSVGRDLGLAILSGGIVGGALVVVESLLASAADARSSAAALRAMLSTTPDLNGIDLADEQLPNLYLPGRALVAAQLCGTNLSGSQLPFADLRYAQLRNADLRHADLRGATLVGADLSGADLRGTLLDDADLSDANLDQADLSDASLVDARAQRTRFGTAELTGATFDNVYLEGADLSAVRGRLELAGGTQYDQATRWPPTFGAPPSAEVIQEPIAEMDLAAYLAYRLRRDRPT
jgi:uncharacterized protein YjbI with pentapeptide repeats